MSELKPCPFCGSNKVKLVKKKQSTKVIMHMLRQLDVIVATQEAEL